MVPRSAPKYTKEFRDDAVALVARSPRSLPQIAKDLGVSIPGLRNWYNDSVGKKRRRASPTKALQPASASEEDVEVADEKVRRLERQVEALLKENQSLKEDRDLLKKAATFFAKESE